MSAAGIRAGRAYVEIGADSQRLDAALVRLRAKLTAFGAGLAGIGGGLAAAAGGVLGALAWPLQLAANLETTEAAFQTMLKDATAAKTLLADLQQFAASTPFEFPELAEAAKMLLAFGSNSADLKNELRTLGDISAGVGVPIGEIAEIYGKARVQGRLFAEDINQLTGRGIPVIQALATQFGVAEPQVKKLVEAGKVGFPELQAALVTLTTGAGQFAGGMERQSKTLLGVLSTLRDNIGAAVRPLGQALLPVVGSLASTLSTLVAVAGKFIEQNQQLAIYVAAGAVGVGALGTMLITVGGLMAGAGLAASSLSAMVGKLGVIAAASLSVVGGSLGLLLTPLGTVGAALAVFVAAAGGVGNAWAIASGMASQALGVIGAAIGQLASMAGGLINGLGGMTANITGLWTSAWGSVRQLASETLSTITDGYSELVRRFGESGSTLVATWQSVVSAVASGNLQAAMEIAAAGLQLAWVQAITAVQQVWNDWTAGFRDGWTDAVTYVAQLGVSAFFGIASTWETVVTAMRTSWDTIATYVMGTLDFIGTRLAQLAALWEALWSDEGQERATQNITRLQQQLEQRAAARSQGNQAATDGMRNESQQRLDAMRSEAADYFNQLAQLGEQEKAARRANNSEAVAEAERRLQEAQARFQALQTQVTDATASQAAQAAKATDTAAQAKGSNDAFKVTGGFNASLAGQQLGLTGVQQQIAKHTAATATAVTKLADRPGLTFA